MGRGPAPQTESGIVETAHSNAMYTVRCSNTERIIASLSGKLRAHYVRIGVGDVVLIERSPYDRTRARIIRREAGRTDEPGTPQRIPR